MSDTTQNTDNSKEGKFYTQNELDRMFAERAARAAEKAKADAEADAQKKLAELEGKLTVANAQADALKKTNASVEEVNKALEETYKGITEGMSAELRGLIPDALPIAERIKHINKNRAVFYPKAEPVQEGTPVVLPNANGNPKPPPVAESKTPLPAQFQSIAEFQIKDPKGCLAWLNSNSGKS